MKEGGGRGEKKRGKKRKGGIPSFLDFGLESSLG